MNLGAAILFLIFSLLFFVLIFRYVSIQITGEAAGQPLAAKAQQKYEKERVIEATRGTIFDRKGEVVAEDTTAYTLVAILDESMTRNEKNPRHVVDPEYTAEELSKYIQMEKGEINKILTKKGYFQVEFGKAGRDIPHKTKREIEALKLPGITFIRDSKRFYPNGIFSSHLVGYVEKNDEKKQTVGMLGLEKSLNSYLEGNNGSLKYESDLWGLLLPDSKKDIKPAKDGNDVYLTIDKKIQTFLEDAINKVDQEYKPKKIIAIVANPKTGDILAMGQRPTFHPSTRVGLEKNWHNEVVETSYEPGSTMKIFTLAAAIEENKFNPNAKYKSGSYKVTENSVPIRDHNYVGWGSITYLEGFQRSSNVAFARLLSENIGYEAFRQYLSDFGFEKPTGIDLPNETTGKIVYTYPIDKITTAFGQGTAVTPIQMIQAASAIANDGKMMKPHVIDRIVNSKTGETVKENKPEVVGEPISPETAKQVRELMESVITSPNGTGKRYAIEGYDVAGKTGTAQIPGSGGYLKGYNNYIFSFLGMAPTDNPELVMYVAVQQPEIDENTSGAVPVSMIFNTVMKSSLQYMNINPIEQKETSSTQLQDLIGQSSLEAVNILTSQGLEPIVIGTGSKVLSQMPMPKTMLLEGEKVILRTDGPITVPDLSGWSFRDVVKFATLSRLELNTAGRGFVTKQNPPKGSTLGEGDFLTIELETGLEQFKRDQKGSSEGEEELEEVVN